MGKKKKSKKGATLVDVNGNVITGTDMAWGIWNTPATNDIIFQDQMRQTPRCSACNKTIKEYSHHSYSGPKIQRHICNRCHTKAMDKLYGVKISADMEDILYKDK